MTPEEFHGYPPGYYDLVRTVKDIEDRIKKLEEAHAALKVGGGGDRG